MHELATILRTATIHLTMIASSTCFQRGHRHKAMNDLHRAYPPLRLVHSAWPVNLYLAQGNETGAPQTVFTSCLPHLRTRLGSKQVHENFILKLASSVAIVLQLCLRICLDQSCIKTLRPSNREG